MPQMNRARGLIYVLTTRALRANGRNFQQLIIGYETVREMAIMRAAAVSCISRLFRDIRKPDCAVLNRRL